MGGVGLKKVIDQRYATDEGECPWIESQNKEQTMDIFKVAIAVEGREIEAFVKAGVLATVETGSHKDKAETPENKISIMVGEGKTGRAAWVQVARFNGDRSLHITHEGWVSEAGGQVQGYASFAPARAMLEAVSNPRPDVL